MSFLEIENQNNQQRLFEQQSYKEYSQKDNEAKNAYFNYFFNYMNKFDTQALLLSIQDKLNTINELNQKMKEMLDKDPNCMDYMFEIYSTSVNKLTKENQIIEMIINER